MAERKWSLTKVNKGDYICWSNDLRMVWRFQSYEDGEALGLDTGYELRTYWKASCMPAEEFRSAWTDEWFSPNWKEIACLLPSRKAAIAEMERLG